MLEASNRALSVDRSYVLQAYEERRKAIIQRLKDFRAVPKDEWFYELCYCLCTPQSKAVHAAQVVEKLKALRFQQHPVDPTSILRDPTHYIRFHNTKAKRLLELQISFPTILKALELQPTAVAARSYLVRELKGVGMKEASHFLRNTGQRGIAIIDRHILKHLHRCGVIDSVVPPTTAKRYEEIEQQWKQFASDICIDMDELDLVFWSLEAGEILK